MIAAAKLTQCHDFISKNCRMNLSHSCRNKGSTCPAVTDKVAITRAIIKGFSDRLSGTRAALSVIRRMSI